MRDLLVVPTRTHAPQTRTQSHTRSSPPLLSLLCLPAAASTGEQQQQAFNWMFQSLLNVWR